MHIDIQIRGALQAKRLVFGEDRNASLTELPLDISLELLRGESGACYLRLYVLNEDIDSLQASQRRACEVAIVGTSRMVKKLETGLTTEFTTLPSPILRPCILSTPSRILDANGWRPKRRCKAYGLEDITGVYHGNGRSGTAVAQ